MKAWSIGWGPREVIGITWADTRSKARYKAIRDAKAADYDLRITHPFHVVRCPRFDGDPLDEEGVLTLAYVEAATAKPLQVKGDQDAYTR